MTQTATSTLKPKRTGIRRFFWRLLWWSSALVLLLVLLVVVLAELFLNRVPSAYHAMARPLAPPRAGEYAALHLDGFESPYLGHTGSANGKGGTMFGGSKSGDLDSEAAMGLRWTFLPVNWSAIERDRAVDLSAANCPQTRQVDDYVIAARQRKLNTFLQIVIGGNAGGPPDWAGRREAGKSAPVDMPGAAAFAGKLAARYAPDGVLSRREKWTDHFGVRAWELDNEPEGYRTSWKGQAGDYAEFVTLSANAIRAVDPGAMIAVAATAGGGHATPWLNGAFERNNIANVADVVSFHCYEGLETAFNRSDRTLVDDFSEVRDAFESHRSQTRPSIDAYWHTEGNFDFLGVLSAKRRAAWRFQFMTRAFAAGIGKVCVMDPSKEERAAVKAYIAALPWPFPMVSADSAVKVLVGQVVVFRHLDGKDPGAGQVWVAWPVAGTGDARVQIPVGHDHVKIVGVDGTELLQEAASNGDQHITLDLKGDAKMAPAVLVIDR